MDVDEAGAGIGQGAGERGVGLRAFGDLAEVVEDGLVGVVGADGDEAGADDGGEFY